MRTAKGWKPRKQKKTSQQILLRRKLNEKRDIEMIEKGIEDHLENHPDKDPEGFLPFYNAKKDRAPTGFRNLSFERWNYEIRQFLILNCYSARQIKNRYRITDDELSEAYLQGKIKIRVKMGHTLYLYSKKEIDIVLANYKRHLPPKLFGPEVFI